MGGLNRRELFVGGAAVAAGAATIGSNGFRSGAEFRVDPAPASPPVTPPAAGNYYAGALQIGENAIYRYDGTTWHLIASHTA